MNKYFNSENVYTEHFSLKYEDEYVIRFKDDNLSNMYTHNYTLIKDEENVYEIILKELDLRKNDKKDFLRIETFFNISDDLISKLSINHDKTIYDFMMIKTENYQDLQGNINCEIKEVNTLELLKECININILANKATLGDFAVKRINRKAQIYQDKNSKIKSYVCFHNKKAIGTCELMIENNLAKIEDFDIYGDYQRKGFGTSVLKHVLKEAYDVGIEEAYLITDSSDTAKEMYKKCGFKKIGEKTELFFKGL